MTTKYIKYAFGVDGDRATVPNASQLDGTVSYQDGFPVGYQLDYGDPASLNIPRDQFNEMMYGVSLAVKQIQENGFPEFITSAMNDGSAYAYALNACVYQPSDGNNYVSLIASNTDVPPSVNWRLITFASGIPAGVGADYWGVTLQTGWVWANGTTIGNASSNATGRANADTSDLFVVLWSLPSATIQLYNSAGTPVSRGVSAAADFAANRAIATPDTRERITAGLGTMGGTTDPARMTLAGCGFSPTTLCAAGGVETYALTSAQLAAHLHTVNLTTSSAGDHFHNNGVADGGANRITVYDSTTDGFPGNSVSGPFGGGAWQYQGTTNHAGTHSHTVSGSTSSVGSGDAHQNTQPTIICNKIIKL